ncbi:hypothetical protein ACFZAR_37850 [Streptomyces sp. NPDC008222]|uniref:hypothetical protein n=1 Tax=Streptomyces sp. NPDC008222 TaxID=3364820 RepID=UPI0036E4DD44
MDEPRDTPADAGSRTPAFVATTRLSPLQEAYGAYTAHTLDCDRCRDVDQRCDAAADLWRVYWMLAVAANRRLGGEAV